MSTAIDIKKEPSGNEGGKRPNKDNGDQGPNRPPIKTKLPGTKPYYALYVNGQHLHVQYIRDGAEWPRDLPPGYAIAWVEEKSRNVHFFLFRLGTQHPLAIRYLSN